MTLPTFFSPYYYLGTLAYYFLCDRVIEHPHLLFVTKPLSTHDSESSQSQAEKQDSAGSGVQSQSQSQTQSNQISESGHDNDSMSITNSESDSGAHDDAYDSFTKRYFSTLRMIEVQRTEALKFLEDFNKKKSQSDSESNTDSKILHIENIDQKHFSLEKGKQNRYSTDYLQVSSSSSGSGSDSTSSPTTLLKDLSTKYPTQNEFDFIWVDNLLEKTDPSVTSPNEICQALDRLSKYGGIICTAKPMADNLYSGYQNQQNSEVPLNHYHWMVNHTAPGNLQFIKNVIKNHPLKLIQSTFSKQEANTFQLLLPQTWDQCVLYAKPLICRETIPVFSADVGKVQRTNMVYDLESESVKQYLSGGGHGGVPWRIGSLRNFGMPDVKLEGNMDCLMRGKRCQCRGLEDSQSCTDTESDDKAVTQTAAVDLSSHPLLSYLQNIKSVELDRFEALEVVKYLKKTYSSKKFKILDLSGGTSAHFRYATHVTDFDNSTRPYSWYEKHSPDAVYIGGVDLGKPLPFPDNYFDFAWATNVFEHAPLPSLICNEVSRIVKLGGVICTPRPISDNLLTGVNSGAHGHKWWWFMKHGSPSALEYAQRRTLLHTNGNMQEHIAYMSFFRNSWEQCVLFRKPLKCNERKTEFSMDMGGKDGGNEGEKIVLPSSEYKPWRIGSMGR